MEEMIGLDFIKYYDAHKNLFKYKMSKEYLKEHKNYEDPMADNCVGSDSEYYVGWTALMIEEVPVFIVIKNYEWVQELCVYMTKEAMLLHNRYEWIRLLEEEGVFLENPAFSSKYLMGLAKDIADKHIGTMKTFEEVDEDSCGVRFYDEPPYVLPKIFKMEDLTEFQTAIEQKHAFMAAKRNNSSIVDKNTVELERGVFRLLESIEQEEKNKKKKVNKKEKSKYIGKLTEEDIDLIVELVKKDLNEKQNKNKNEKK